MKKLLSILGAMGIIASGTSTAMAMTPVGTTSKAIIDDLDVIDVTETATVKVGQATSVLIKNYDKLINVQAKSLNEDIASVSISYGAVNIVGKKPGRVEIFVSANNAESVYINTTVGELIKIDVTRKIDVSTGIGWSDLWIQNFQDLTGVRVSSADETIATAQMVYDSVRISGKSVGTVKATVTANNGLDATILITVHKSEEIAVAPAAAVYLGEITSIKIENFQDLTNVHVQSDDEQIATAGIIGDEVMIKGMSVGTVDLLIAAVNGMAIVTVTVMDLKTIDIAKNASVDEGKFVELKINNFVDLTKVTVKSKDAWVAIAGILENGIVIKGITMGKTEVLVSADHALDALINVTVN